MCKRFLFCFCFSRFYLPQFQVGHKTKPKRLSGEKEQLPAEKQRAKAKCRQPRHSHQPKEKHASKQDGYGIQARRAGQKRS